MFHSKALSLKFTPTRTLPCFYSRAPSFQAIPKSGHIFVRCEVNAKKIHSFINSIQRTKTRLPPRSWAQTRKLTASLIQLATVPDMSTYHNVELISRYYWLRSNKSSLFFVPSTTSQVTGHRSSVGVLLCLFACRMCLTFHFLGTGNMSHVLFLQTMVFALCPSIPHL